METPKKTFILKIEARAKDCPQTFTFENMSMMEQVAIWEIIKRLAEQEQNKLFNQTQSL